VVRFEVVTEGYYASSTGQRGNEYRVYLRNTGNVRVSCSVTGRYQYSFNGRLESGTRTTTTFLNVNQTDYVLFGLNDQIINGVRFEVNISMTSRTIECQRA
jgi:hypothetical protein